MAAFTTPTAARASAWRSTLLLLGLLVAALAQEAPEKPTGLPVGICPGFEATLVRTES